MISSYILAVILISALLTFLPRVLPFVLVKYSGIPDIVVRFLKYLPVSIIFALLLSSLVDSQPGKLPSLLPMDSFAAILSLLVALRTRNMVATVVVGVVSLALLRLVFA